MTPRDPSPESQLENPPPVSDPNRETRIAELKARYQAGKLCVDEQAVASKLVAHLLNEDSIEFDRS